MPWLDWRNGRFQGEVLDVGCGAGEHTIYLTRLGYSVLGLDASVPAVRYARRNAHRQNVSAAFEVADATQLGGRAYDTILDSALFHIFDPVDRLKYVRSLSKACLPGGILHMLALSDEGPGFGPEVGVDAIREAFSDGWTVEDIVSSRYQAIATPDHHVTDLGFDPGERVELPALLARIRRL
jgi:SAM-dependent methyltransferase